MALMTNLKKGFAMILVMGSARWLYDPSFQCDFTFDDHLAVVNNADVDTTRTSSDVLWQHDIWGKDLRKIDSHKSWRPLLMFSFRLSHAAENGYNASAFHFLGIWLHTLVSGLMLLLADQVLEGSNLEISTLVALTFAVHPVHVEGVTSIVNRAEPLCALFVILSSGLSITEQESSSSSPSSSSSASVEQKKNQENPSFLYFFVNAFWNCLKQLFWISIVSILFFLAVMSKETGLTMVAILTIFDILQCNSVDEQNKEIKVVEQEVETKEEEEEFKVSSQDENDGRMGHVHYKIMKKVSFDLSKKSSKQTLKGSQDSSEKVLSFKNLENNIQNKEEIKHNLSSLQFYATMCHWVMILFRVCILFTLTLAYLLFRLHMMTQGGVLTKSWGLNLDELDFSSMSLDHSGLIRRAENPFALIEEGSMSSILSIGYLHFRYAWLLVFPRTLSAEYSYNCVPAIESLADPRNLLTVSAYFALLSLICYGVRNPRTHRGLLESLAWGIFPFLPASCIFTKVGTLIAERLLYLPSIGYCLLLGWCAIKIEDMLMSCASQHVKDNVENTSSFEPSTDQTTPQTNEQDCSPTTKLKTSNEPRNFWLRAIWWVMIAIMIARTRLRIADWTDDWSLFHAALQTCPHSAKTHNQVGQLHMGKGDPATALTYYKKAAELDPLFCDSDYTQALAYVNLGDLAEGKRLLRKSLHCVFTSNGAFSNLQLIWKHELAQPNGQNNPVLLEDIGDTLIEIVKGAKMQENEAKDKKLQEDKIKQNKISFKIFQKIIQIKNYLSYNKSNYLMNTMNEEYSIPMTSPLSSHTLYDQEEKIKNNKRKKKQKNKRNLENKEEKRIGEEEAQGEESGLSKNALDHLQSAGVIYFHQNKFSNSIQIFEKIIKLANEFQFERCEVRYWLSRSYLAIANEELSKSKHKKKQLKRTKTQEFLQESLKHIDVATSLDCPISVSKPSREVKNLVMETLSHL